MADVASILSRPVTAVVATTNADGSPHAVPVWFRHDAASGTIRVWTDVGRHWVRNLLRDPRCSVTVAEHAPPFAGYVATGRATLHEDVGWADAEIRAITSRYIAAEEVEAYVAPWEFKAIVEIAVERERSWERGY